MNLKQKLKEFWILLFCPEKDLERRLSEPSIIESKASGLLESPDIDQSEFVFMTTKEIMSRDRDFISTVIDNLKERVCGLQKILSRYSIINTNSPTTTGSVLTYNFSTNISQPRATEIEILYVNKEAWDNLNKEVIELKQQNQDFLRMLSIREDQIAEKDQVIDGLQDIIEEKDNELSHIEAAEKAIDFNVKGYLGSGCPVTPPPSKKVLSGSISKLKKKSIKKIKPKKHKVAK